ASTAEKAGVQLPLAAVCLPARDIGAPYFARFSGVSGTGPFVTVMLVKVAEVLTPAEGAELAPAVLSVIVASVVVVVVAVTVGSGFTAPVVSEEAAGPSVVGLAWALVPAPVVA